LAPYVDARDVLMHIAAFDNVIPRKCGDRGMSFEVLSEMTADIRTVEAQLASPKAKTAIIRECFASLLQTAKSARQTEWERVLEDLLGKDGRGH